ncbi:hypothetical protein GCM10025881_15050 [Pseudolysinimonas kribbensis]|uniref:Uncharacterized protein n=1 Tax=Pseudolysinimonas kribbensis TaxID=433641 RepID=A0ABQ6K4N5_9MICO|nr:hypothetical protein GCM10025881_15050 [Pseudolysinimonas kribbensis]
MEGPQRGEHEHRGGDPGLAEGFDDVDPVGAGQPAVDDEGVELAVACGLEPGPGIRAERHRIALFEDAAHHRAEIAIVFDQQQTGSCVVHAGSSVKDAPYLASRNFRC